jgi:pyridinium-3,5-bisthiocarboxylic acid mononucleotide nickel chelatase
MSFERKSMKTAYFNCSSGVAGDMIIASCIDAGVSAKLLETKLKSNLKLKGWSLKAQSVQRGHTRAHTFKVEGDQYFSSPAEMKKIVSGSTFSAEIRTKALKILDTLIAAEAAVHGTKIDKVHFHELSSIDTIIDIVGACVCFKMLDIEKIYCSEINIGRAAPAAIEIMRAGKIPVYSNNSSVELATPTGVAIMAILAEEFGRMPGMRITGYGFGAGSWNERDSSNLLRLMTGEVQEPKPNYWGEDEVVLLETNIDDMDPRIYAFAMEKLFKAGALDVWLTQVIMKKSRPGTVLSVLGRASQESFLAGIIFEETTTLGIRRSLLNRFVLRRNISKDNKISYLNNNKIKTKSEFEKARLKSLKNNLPLKDILI